MLGFGRSAASSSSSGPRSERPVGERGLRATRFPAHQHCNWTQVPNAASVEPCCGHRIRLNADRKIRVSFGPLLEVPVAPFIVDAARGHVASPHAVCLSALVWTRRHGCVGVEERRRDQVHRECAGTVYASDQLSGHGEGPASSRRCRRAARDRNRSLP